MPMHRLRLSSFVRRWALVAGLAVCCIGTGCGSGGQTGGEFPASGGCEATYEELALDAPTPLGVTPASVLEPVLGTHSSPLLWSADTGSLSIGPEQGLSQVELTASYEGGRIAWARFGLDTSSAAAGQPAPLLGCGVDRLEVELEPGLNLLTGGLRPLRNMPEVMSAISGLRADDLVGVIYCVLIAALITTMIVGRDQAIRAQVYERGGRVFTPNLRYRLDIGERLIGGDLARGEAWGYLG